MTQIALIEQIDACMKKFRGDRIRHQINANEFLPDEFPAHLNRAAEASAIVSIVREHDPFIINAIEAALWKARKTVLPGF